MTKIRAAKFEQANSFNLDVLELILGATVQHKKPGSGIIKGVSVSPRPIIQVKFSQQTVDEVYIYLCANLKDLFIDFDISPEKFASLI